MHNSTRSGRLPDTKGAVRDSDVRGAERSGKAGEDVERRSFTIKPKTAVIEISGGRVEFRVEKKSESA